VQPVFDAIVRSAVHLRIAVREWLLFQIVEVEDLPLHTSPATRFAPA
jgi:hypothetical protein